MGMTKLTQASINAPEINWSLDLILYKLVLIIVFIDNILTSVEEFTGKPNSYKLFDW